MSEHSRAKAIIPAYEATGLVPEGLLEGCTRESEFISKKLAWRAPKGHAFSVTSNFIVYQDTSDAGEMLYPTLSWEAFLEEHGDEFNRYLEDADGDEREALRLFELEDEYFGAFGPYIQEFQGEWLIDDIDPDGRPTLTVRGAVRARVIEAAQHFESKPELSDEPILFEAFTHDAYWRQSYVNLEKGKASLSLKEIAVKEEGLYLPPPATQTTLSLPMTGGEITSDNLAKYYSYGGTREGSEEQKLAIIRENRRRGTPLADDPLKRFILPRIVVVDPSGKAKNDRSKSEENLDDIPF